MLLDRPARVLYKLHVDLYRPLGFFACKYRWIVRVGVALLFAWIAQVMLGNPRTLAGLSVLNGPVPAWQQEVARSPFR